ncbi:uncharacterized protein LOC102711137 [Oryza brachyantha]|nr:uncharacterized protein LOC102711137 [Oryza brachyantha]
MAGAARKKINLIPSRRSARLKNIHVYDEDSEKKYPTLEAVKSEVIDLEEIASPSTPGFNGDSVGDKDDYQDFQNVSLKDLRAQCKAKDRKAPKVNSEGPDFRNQRQCGKRNLEDEVPNEEVDLDKPIIAFRQKRHKISPTKSNRTMGKPTYTDTAKLQDTTLKREIMAENLFSLEVKLHDSTSTAETIERRVPNVEHSVAAGNTEEIVGDNIFYAEMENTIISTDSAMSGRNPDLLCEIKTEDENNYSDEQIGGSSSGKDSFQHSSAELHGERIVYNGCKQSGVIPQLTELKAVPNDSCELANSVEAYCFDEIMLQNKRNDGLSSLDITDDVSNNHKPSGNATNSDGEKSSVVNHYLVCSANQSCADIDEYWYPGVLHGSTLETTKTVESCTDQCNTEVGSPSMVIQSDLCRTAGRNFTLLAEDVQMKEDGKLDSLVQSSVGTKDILLHMDFGHATNDCTFAFNKTLDSVQTANSTAQDGWLESIVYDALSNRAQRKSTETESPVGASSAAIISSPFVTEDTDRDLTGSKAPYCGQLLIPCVTEWLSKDTDQLKTTVDDVICKTNSGQGSREQFGLQPHLLQSFSDLNKACVTSESSDPEQTQEIPVGSLYSTVASLDADGQSNNSQPFTEEGAIEEHGPKKLLSKRKIMSPTSQEKLCNALTGIDLCRVQKLKKKILLEDCDKIRKPNSRSSRSPTSKGILKATESPPSQETTCTCMKASSVLLDTGKAVEFSQRQMHDVENIASKLIRSLKQMRSIVDESLLSEAHSLLPNFNTAEIRAASEDALEVERTTRKWLTIMNKDCSRFCKILTLAGKKAVSHSEVPRKRKKITFADETGGKLCHVKVFNDGQTSCF